MVELEEKKKMPEREGRQLNIRLTDQEYQELQKLAQSTGKSYHDLVCENMVLASKMELAPSRKVIGKGRLANITNEDVSAFVRKAMEDHSGWFGVDVVDAAKEIAQIAKWDDLVDADRLFLLLHLLREDVDEQTKSLTKLANILDTDERTLRAFFKRIVKTGERSYDLRIED